MITTSYGTWNNLVDPRALSVEQTISEALGAFGADYDIDAIAADYRAAINAALPEGVSLNGNDFYGPYDKDDRLDIKSVVDSVDFWAIVAKHDTSA